MQCESCTTKPVEVYEPIDNEHNPFRLCVPCRNRLLSYSLRPLEYFNLTAIHGHTYYLHDDFYDDETGEAMQPEVEVVDADKFPFPVIEQIKGNLNMLIDYSFVQYFTSDEVVNQLMQFDKSEVLQRIAEKVKYNRAIHYKAYPIVARVIGRAAEQWIKTEWANRKENELQIFAEALVKCLEFDQAFEIITQELEAGDDKFLSENAFAMVYFQSEKTLQWIEKVSHRITNVSSTWGQLAASSRFSWNRGEQWLTSGRPLSLIALDSLIYCTNVGERANQSIWLKQLNPQLTDNTKPDVVARRLQDYLTADHAPRVKNAVALIIGNMFQ
jgi:hypothetical protein